MNTRIMAEMEASLEFGPAEGEPYILTYSGARVGPYHGMAPIQDIAVALSRLPRFGGHGSAVNWSVIDHSLFVEKLAEMDDDVVDPRLRMAALLHDAHEAFTGDVPSPFKTPGLKARQNSLDRRIFAMHAPEVSDTYRKEVADIIKTFDKRSLLAEFEILGPRAVHTAADVEAHMGEVAQTGDVRLLDRMIDSRDLLATAQDRDRGLLNPVIVAFLRKYEELRGLLK